jgi:DNA-binding transcriptional LysR family regulator
LAEALLLPAVVMVTGPETNVASACLGLGLIQVPRYRVEAELASGALVEVLPDFPPTPLPVHILYSGARRLSPRLRVFIDWAAERYRGLNIRLDHVRATIPIGAPVPVDPYRLIGVNPC